MSALKCMLCFPLLSLLQLYSLAVTACPLLLSLHPNKSSTVALRAVLGGHVSATVQGICMKFSFVVLVQVIAIIIITELPALCSIC